MFSMTCQTTNQPTSPMMTKPPMTTVSAVASPRGTPDPLQPGDGGLEQRGDQQRGDEGEHDQLYGADDPHQHPDGAGEHQQPPADLGGDPHAPRHGGDRVGRRATAGAYGGGGGRAVRARRAGRASGAARVRRRRGHVVAGRGPALLLQPLRPAWSSSGRQPTAEPAWQLLAT